jgi:hypothetical protein
MSFSEGLRKTGRVFQVLESNYLFLVGILNRGTLKGNI